MNFLRSTNHVLLTSRAFGFYGYRFKKGRHFEKFETELKQIPIDIRLLRSFELFKEDCKDAYMRVKNNRYIMKREKYKHGEGTCVAKFDTAESLRKWFVADDRWEGSGTSEAHLTYDPVSQCAVVSGHIDSDLSITNSGSIKKKGFLAFKSKEQRNLLTTHEPYDWTSFTHIAMLIRGDGRQWTLNLNTPGPFDVFAFDMFSYPLFTRGGPYWQFIRIPFSKFVFQSKGSLQDVPAVVPLNQIFSLTFCLMEYCPGPFRLDVKSIYVMNDMTHRHKVEYETYKLPNLIITGYF
ncbi:hypothetical protein GJ496_007948 [Pomphorhynchus laevis]|nr:hypothetical protein GJ496_007948 [Pomphorhynchus laevis]